MDFLLTLPINIYIYTYIVRAAFGPKAQTRWTKAQRAQNNEFVESGLETELQWVGQQFAGKYKQTILGKENPPRQCSRKVVLM